jgi:hypothetical protein
MSSEDRLKPYHAKKASGQEAADAVAAVLLHAADRDKAQAKRPELKKQPKWMLPLGINLGVFAVYLLIAPPAWVVVNPLEGPPIEEQADDMRLAMYMQAMRVSGFVQQNGQLPLSLSEAGSTYPGIEYSVQGPNRFQLSATVGDTILTYDSTQPANDWIGAEATGRLLGGG